MHHRADAPSSPFASNRVLLAWTAAALVCLMAWDASGQDLAMARLFGSDAGFPLREQWFFVHVMHEGARRLGWVVVLLMALGVWWPRGMLRQLQLGERMQLVSSALLALAVISIFKNLSATSCPWDLAEFGGVARHVSHWALGVLDGGGGHCFPAGHASAGFAFVGGYFALRRRHAQAARLWLGFWLLTGLVLGGAQQVRGAHFMSHTLWTGWLCWTAGWLWDMAFQAWRKRANFMDSTPATLGSEPQHRAHS
jgi:membrane-associated PAP2 superfamily phosphatase